MQGLLKQTKADIAEVEKTIVRLKHKLSKAKHTMERQDLKNKVLAAETMLSDLMRYKAEIKDYIKIRSENDA